MANTYGDLPPEAIMDTSKFKSLVDGGEALDAEKKYHDPYTFKNKAKLIFSANHIPDTTDKSYGYFRRWILIHFKRVFDAIDDVKGLGEQLVMDEQEIEGMILLAFDGLKMLQEEGGSLENRATDKDIGSILTLKGCNHKQLRENYERAYYYTHLALRSEIQLEQTTL